MLLVTAVYPAAFVAIALGGVGLIIDSLLLGGVTHTAIYVARPAILAVVGDSVPRDKVGRALSLLHMSSATGFILGTVALGYVAMGGVRGAVLASFAASAVALALVALLRETDPRRSVAVALRAAGSSLRRALAAYVAGAVALMVVGFEMRWHLLGYFELPMWTSPRPGWGVCASTFFAVHTLGAPLVGALMDRLGSFPSYMAGVAALAPSFLGIMMPQPFVVESRLAAFTLFVMIALGSLLSQVAGDRVLVDVTRPGARGTVLASLSLVGIAAEVASLRLGTALWNAAGGPFLVPAGMAATWLAGLLPLFAAWRLWRRGERL